MRRWGLAWWVATGTGLALILTGTGIVVSGAYASWLSGENAAARQYNDESALSAWLNGGSEALAGAVSTPSTPGPSPSGVTSPGPGCDVGGSQAYALVSFTGLPKYGYAGVAVNGNWTQLENRSMVHWYGSPAPGGEGDVIIAFHREPDFQYIDQLSPGETVTIQDQGCDTYVYTITQRWVLAPSAVTQLVPTSGHVLTLITCTPWWQDYDRMVWRAQLTSVNGIAVSSS
jgi:LPXTG-site transpeptidase (sortase) family protein